jgi:2-C-methyl-D-erythritol 4-phosphate cytidylyltransferase/2-C-methyl-D-erythritol 2,4-cyclodiphosphate synthase
VIGAAAPQRQKQLFTVAARPRVLQEYRVAATPYRAKPTYILLFRHWPLPYPKGRTLSGGGMSRTAALIVAGGSGSRVGDGLSKQYRPVAGVPMLRRSIETFLACPTVTSVQVVVGANHAAAYNRATAGLLLCDAAVGGDTRQESVRRGLEALSGDSPDFILIHDAARPLVSTMLIEAVAAALSSGAEAVLPLLPVPDSLRCMQDGHVGSSLPREGVCRAQTPQGFAFAAIRDAHERFAGSNATDDISLAERAGLAIAAVAGEEINFKITTAQDFDMAERLLAGSTETRTGMGFDVHRFVAGDHLWLCGVRIPHTHALQGHSDADAGLHALTDAILGALAAGDIGQHFPPSDERWRGAPSRQFLEHAAELVRTAGGAILHSDVTVICERPKLAPYRDAMRACIADILHTDVSRVSVKATTSDGLGFTGRGEGIGAQAVATIRLPRL